MKIEVVYDDEVLFNGNADVFLEENDYDEELGELLNELSEKEFGDTVCYYGNQGMKYEIERLMDLLWVDEE